MPANCEGQGLLMNKDEGESLEDRVTGQARAESVSALVGHGNQLSVGGRDATVEGYGLYGSNLNMYSSYSNTGFSMPLLSTMDDLDKLPLYYETDMEKAPLKPKEYSTAVKKKKKSSACQCVLICLACVIVFCGLALLCVFQTDILDVLGIFSDDSDSLGNPVSESEGFSSSGVLGTSSNRDYRGTILISLDGFRHDYLDRGITPNLDMITQGGTRAKRMTSQFPSKTFVNHWSIITGLYPETHGIIDNEFYNPVTGKHFTNKDPNEFNNPEWWHGDPLWSTVKNQNEVSASMFWVGNAINDKHRKASLSENYDSSVSLDDRVSEVLSWMDRPVERRPKFTAVYMETTDTIGHLVGPNHKKMTEAIKTVDSAVGKLLKGLYKRELLDSLDIIVVSDHGMTQLSEDRVIMLNKLINYDAVSHHVENCNTLLYPKPGFEMDLYANLTSVSLNMKVYVKNPSKYVGLGGKAPEPIPEKFHFRNSNVVPEIILLADLGWSIVADEKYDPKWVRGGNHGYDPSLKDMGGIFIAKGPHFKEDAIVNDMNNINVYSLVCHILGVEPSPNNGTVPIEVLR
eukprot:Nk52_evm58s554 gene=Nk52_evmTU58s554